MKKVAVSQAKARLLSLVDEVAKTGESIIVTKRGMPLVKMVKFRPEKPKPFIGRLVGIVEVSGDLLEPAVRPEDWDLD